MEIRERLCGFWSRITTCFRKPASKTEKDPVTVIKKPSAPPPAAPRLADPNPVPGAPNPGPGAPHRELYVALYDYSARTNKDLSFNLGDTLEALDKSSDEWWFTKALTGISSGKQGYIPANYVAAVESIDAQPWYFPDTKRQDAEKMLLSEMNHRHGCFLIRNCESQTGELSLSVVDDGKVKHYKVRRDQGSYFVSKTRTFLTLKDLVQHYSKQADGLCVRLGQPCKKIEAPQTFGLSYNTVDQWEIERETIKLVRKLGAGQFGEVFEGIWNGTTSVAVKTLKPGSMDTEDFLREAHIMKRLRHDKLIQLYAVCTTEEPIYIITELMNNGSLLEYLQKDKGSTLRFSDQVEMTAQVAAGMSFLEQQNYIHRDLAARNVLVGENNICKVADFGLARVFMNENVYEIRDGTKFPVRWTAPEVIRHNKFTIKSDVWSFGILLYEVMTFGHMPYPTMTNYQVIQQVPEGHRMSCPTKCPEFMYSMMMECWNTQEMERPTFETLLWRLEDFFEQDVPAYV